MTTAISDAFTYPLDKTATDADHAPLGVALSQALAAAGLTKVSGPTTLADWETAAFVGDATMVWDFNDVVAGAQNHLYIKFILRTGLAQAAADTGWAVTVCANQNFTGDSVSANWFAGASTYTRPNARYYVSYADSCLAMHVDYPLPEGQSQTTPNALVIERSRSGSVPTADSAALFVAAVNAGLHVFKVLLTGAFPGTFAAVDAQPIQHPLGIPITLGKLHVTPISWFDRAGVRRTMAGMVLLPFNIGARQSLQISNAGQTKEYITTRDRPVFAWGMGGAIMPNSGNYTCALRWV